MSKILKYRIEAEQTPTPGNIKDVFLKIHWNYYPKLRSIHEGHAIFWTEFIYSRNIYIGTVYVEVICHVPLTDPCLTNKDPVMCLTPTQAMPYATFKTRR